jgi:hypothetical protein
MFKFIMSQGKDIFTFSSEKQFVFMSQFSAPRLFKPFVNLY